MLGHDHSHHGHSQAPENYNRAFAIGVALNLAYVFVEAGFGLRANSLALLADAGHNLSDVLSLLLAWAASHLSQLKPSKRRTYGWGRSSIIAALLNAILLLVAIGGIGWEAIHRFASPEAVPGQTMMAVAGFGVLINAGTAVLFMRGREHDLNIRGAFLHMAADAGVSAAVVVGGFIISRTSLFWIDPMLSLLVVAVIAIGTWSLLRDSLNLSLDAVPAGIEIAAVERYLTGLPGITRVHDLHVWAMSTTGTALTAHLVCASSHPGDGFIAAATRGIAERFGISHVTLQVEAGNCGKGC